MKSVFNFLTRTALRFRAVTIGLVAVVMVLGGVAASQLQQELLPPVEFPQTIVLAQASGMNSDQVLSVMTERLEETILAVPEVVNVESQTSSGFAFLTASNDFTPNQAEIRDKVRAQIDTLYFPTRSIQPPEGETAGEFAARLLNDLSPDVLLYLAEDNPNLLFQLSPVVWENLSDETVRVLAGYLAGQVSQGGDAKSALEQLVEQEVLPQLESVDRVAQVQISGGQALPGENNATQSPASSEVETAPESLLLQLSPDVWDVIAPRIDEVDALNQDAVDALRDVDASVPGDTPALPESWQMDRFKDASDLAEMGSLTRSLSAVFNDFATTGEIKGALGQTDDLTPDVINRMLEIEPTLVEAFGAEELVAMSDEVFAALPDDLAIDGFTRDELAASELAAELTGDAFEPEPVPLPAAWRIPPPQIITFSFADIPLATFSVFNTGEVGAETTDTASTDNAADNDPDTANSDSEDSDTANNGGNAQASNENTAGASDSTIDVSDVPEGPDLPQLFTIFGEFFGAELTTADDLIRFQVSDEVAQLFGGDTVRAADLLNSLTLLNNLPAGVEGGPGGLPGAGDFNIQDAAQFLPALQECNIGLLDLQSDDFNFAEALIGCLDADVVQFLAENDPAFVSSLNADVFQYFQPDVLQIEGIAPPLPDVWSTLANRPQFEDVSLADADDLLAIGNGSASEVLNTINTQISARFSGYEVRLFNSLSPRLLDYLASQEEGFYSNLSAGVLQKLSPNALSNLPDAVISNLDDDTADTLQAIASGEQPSAAEALSDDYERDVPPPRPDAPPLNQEWSFVAQSLGLTLNNAWDLFRLPERYGSPGEFINSFFETPAGSNFAPQLLGNLSLEAFNYVLDEDPNFINDLSPRALRLLSDEVYETLPERAQERAESGQVFVPETQVTRTNGSPSLLITVFKTSEANTVEAFYDVTAVIDAVDAENDNIAVEVAFEQASFIEESISGVVQSGLLGAFFAIVNILIFLSGGSWGETGRRISGAAVLAAFATMLAVLVLNRGSLGAVFNPDDEIILFGVLSVLGILAGMLIVIWPGNLPYPSWRPTLVIAVSIPLSILAALALMRWLPDMVAVILSPIAGTDVAQFITRLAPQGLTLNIMTLSGLTVAVGRLVDDSIVVLENIFRELQKGKEKKEAVLYATKDVSVAIFSATSIAVIVFLPLGLTGGLIAEFFLPFGLAVTYTLLSSFLTAITVVPVLAYIFVSAEHVPEEQETWMQRTYIPVLKWVLNGVWRRVGVIVLAGLSVLMSVYLFSQRPAAFLPEFGEPQIVVSVDMPQGTNITETNERASEMEAAIRDVIPLEELTTIRTIVGGGGLNFDALLGGGGVSENLADITVSVESSDELGTYDEELRQRAFDIFGEDNVSVSVGTLSSGGFGGFEMVVSGADQETLEALNDDIIQALENLPELRNVSSNLQATAGGDSQTYVRVNGTPALSYTGELQTDDTINFTAEALEAIQENVDLPEGVTVGQGFDSELQTEGFSSIFVAMGIASVLVILILALVFKSPVYGLVVILSVAVAPVGASVALTLTDRVLGISALIGMLMLLGLVVTNAIVLIDRVSSNRTERGMNLYDALVEGGARRVRPILMTALTTIIGLIPLAIGLSEGAIIAAELGTVVIGGIISSTLLTLIVVPAAYYLATPLHDVLMRAIGRGDDPQLASEAPDKRKS